MNVLCDSQSVIHLATNPAYHSRTKHIDIRYHFLRHEIDGKKLALQNVHTWENCADIFTKPIIAEELQWCLASLGSLEEMMNGHGQGTRKMLSRWSVLVIDN